MAKLETIRAFVAVRLNPEVTNQVAEFEKQMRAELSGPSVKVTWVPPANIHQTIKFLGPIDPALVDALRKTLVEVASGLEPFSVRAKGFGAFPSPKAPRVLWVGLDDPSGGLAGLFGRVEDALFSLGFPKEKRPFSPHLTLGRVRRGQLDVTAQVEATADTEFGTSKIDEILLYESRLLRTGAEYVVLARAGLGAAAGEGDMERRGPRAGGDDH